MDLNETCEDDWGHGTYVAGILGGNTYGVAKRVSIISLKVVGSDGSSRFSDVIAAIEHVIEQKILNPYQPMVMNLSLGTSKHVKLLVNAVNDAVAVGITAVVAAGNGNSDACTFSPAAAERAITVGASTPYE